MTVKKVRTAHTVSREKRTILVDQLWNGIREAIDLIDPPDQKRELMLDLEKCRSALKPVSLHACSPEEERRALRPE